MLNVTQDGSRLSAFGLGLSQLAVLGVLCIGIGSCIGDDLQGPAGARYPLFEGVSIVTSSGSAETDAFHEAFWAQGLVAYLGQDQVDVIGQADAAVSGADGEWWMSCDH